MFVVVCFVLLCSCVVRVCEVCLVFSCAFAFVVVCVLKEQRTHIKKLHTVWFCVFLLLLL